MIVLSQRVLLVVLCVALVLLVFSRSPVGTDSYWIASLVRDGGWEDLSRPTFFFALNSVLFKLGVPLFFLVRVVPVVGVFACFSSMVLLARKVLSHYKSEFVGLGRGFWCKFGIPDEFFLGLLCFGFPVFWYRGLVFEEELFGIAFCLLSLFFVFDWIEGRSSWVLPLFCFVVGLGFWRGAVFFLPVFGLLGLQENRRWLSFLLPLSVVGVACAVVGGFFPVASFGVAEGLPGVFTVVYAWGFGVLGLVLFRSSNRFFWGLGLLALPGLYVSRFVLLGVFGLAFGVFWLALDLRGWRRVWRGLELVFDGGSFLRMFFIVGVLVGVGVFLFRMVPFPGQLECMEDVVVLSGGGLVGNEWQYGHWLRWFGGVPEFSPLSNSDDLEASNASCLLGECSSVLGLRERLVLNCSGVCLACR